MGRVRIIVLFNCVQPSGWMPKTKLIMKYKTADYIRSMLFALTLENGNDDYVAACRPRVDGDDVWEVCLFTRFDNRAEYFSLVILAKAICEIVPTLVMYEGRYNIAAYGEDYKDAIIIW